MPLSWAALLSVPVLTPSPSALRASCSVVRLCCPRLSSLAGLHIAVCVCWLAFFASVPVLLLVHARGGLPVSSPLLLACFASSPLVCWLACALSSLLCTAVLSVCAVTLLSGLSSLYLAACSAHLCSRLRVDSLLAVHSSLFSLVGKH